jgi:transposase
MGTPEKMSETTIGVDISKAHLDACRWPGGETLRVRNDPAGHKALIRWIARGVARVVFEPTGAYHRGLEHALGRAGIAFSKVNPARARRFAEAVGTHAKTDRIDASLLARLGALLEPALAAPKPAVLDDLAELHLARAALVRDRTAAKNRAERLTLPLLRRQRARALRAIERALAEVDAAIAALIAGDEILARKAAILCSIPGISAITAAAILAGMPELGELEPGDAASLAGLAPVTRQSGQWKGPARIGGGRADLRRALYMPALTAVRFNPDLKVFYDRLRTAGKPAKLALTAVMRKLLILANALLRDGRKWEITRP